MLSGCTRGTSDDASARAGATARVDTPATVASVTRDSVGTASTKAPCPPTGLWTACAVFERLDRGGLAPRVDTGRIETTLTARGQRLRIGNSELDVFIYPDSVARARDEARLDRSKYVDYATALGMQPLPTLIKSANLLAVLHSRNDHQRERVGDALTAGPPQP